MWIGEHPDDAQINCGTIPQTSPTIPKASMRIIWDIQYKGLWRIDAKTKGYMW